jgi:hypothetical protein
MDSIKQGHRTTTSMSIANNNNTDPEELRRVGRAYTILFNEEIKYNINSC